MEVDLSTNLKKEGEKLMWKKRWKEHLTLFALDAISILVGFYFLDKENLAFKVGGVIAFIIALGVHLYQLAIVGRG